VPKPVKLVLAAATAAAAFALPTTTASADVCVTYDFAGSELCVLETVQNPPVTGPVAPPLGQDVCLPVTIDFTGRQLCLSEVTG